MNYVNTLSKYPITAGWKEHQMRGSLGGIDFACGVGTPIPAPCDGQLSSVKGSGSGGNMATFVHASGFKDQFLHLSRFAPNGSYKQGQIIGYSGGRPGDQGAGTSTGPHIHWHLIDPKGKRVNPLDHVSSGAAAESAQPSAASVSISNSKATIQQRLRDFGLYSGLVDGLLGPKSWTAIQTYLSQVGLYTGKIDGAPGKLTYKAFQNYAKNSGFYPGPLDSILGPLSFAGFAQALTKDFSVREAKTQITAQAQAVAAAESARLATEAAIVEADAAEQEKIKSEKVLKEQEKKIAESKALLDAKVKSEIAAKVETYAKKASDNVSPKPDAAVVVDSSFEPVSAEEYEKIQDKAKAIELEDDVSQYDLVDIRFWNYAGERVLKTFAMTASGILTTTGAVVVTNPGTAGVFAEIGWAYIVSVAVVSSLNSLLVALSSFKNIATFKSK